MQDIAPRIISILQKYMAQPSGRISPQTLLSDLEIDFLDLPMICLDIEEIFDVQIVYEDQIEDNASVAALMSCVAEHLHAKTSQPQSRAAGRRPKRTWACTGVDRRR
jgi:acyl carrier protein